MCDRYGIDTPVGAAVCSHGTCVNDFCVCDVGYTSRVDFWIDPGYDCDTPIVFVQVLSWFMVIIRICLTLLCIYNIVGFEHSILTQKAWTGNQRHKTRVNAYWLVCNVGFVVEGVGRITDPQNGFVALNTAVSVGRAAGQSFSLAGYCVYIAIIIEFLRNSSSVFSPGAKEYFNHTIAAMERPMFYFEFVSLMGIAFVIAGCVAPEYGNKILMFFLLWIALVLGTVCYVLFLCLSSFCSELTAYTQLNISSGKDIQFFKTLNSRLQLLQYFAASFGCLAFFLIAFAASPYLRHKCMFYNLITMSLGEVWPHFFCLLVILSKYKRTSSYSYNAVKVTAAVTPSSEITASVSAPA